MIPKQDGPSLRERLAEAGALSLADALSVLRDVARALAYAHEHGVMHRDVKPDNVMLSGDAAVVTDFGIAKALSAALTDVSGPTLTQSGSAIGTPAYMAPEQATGDPSTDHRADIYSFGCLAYELFAGNPPFPNLPMHLVIAAHIGTAARPVTEFRADVPPTIAALIARCLEKNPAVRPQSARELLATFDGVATTSSGSGPATVAAVPAGRRTLRWAVLAVTALLVSAAVYLGTRGAGGSAPIRLAVLPFGNMNADSTLNSVAQVLPDEVAGALSRAPGVQIVSRSGARAFQGQLGVDVTEAGKKLGAEYVMTGVIRQERGRWIVSADLARAADKASLWTENFDLGPDQSAEAADAIATSVLAGLRNRFPRAIGASLAAAPNRRTTNNEAYRLYLKGQEQLNRRGQSVRESAEWFRQAIHLDTMYAPAYSGLSMSLALFPFFQGVPVDQVQDQVVGASRRALALDSTLAQPHVALGVMYQDGNQWDSAATEYETAVRLDARNVEARVQYARHLLFRGRHSEGMEQLRAARAEDPASALVLSWVSYGYFLEGRMDSALTESDRAMENDPANLSTIGLRGWILVRTNRLKEARAFVDRSPPWHRLYVIAKTDPPEIARKRIRDLEAERPQPWLVDSRRAYGYLGLGDTVNALSALERATDRKEPWTSLFGVTDPVYDPIRGSARYQALLKRVGLAR